MRHFVWKLLTVLYVSLLSMQFATAQEHGMAIQEARESLNRFIEKWNSGSDVAVREELSFPHISHGPNGFVVVHEPEDWFVGYENLRGQGWASSSFNNVTARQAGENKVNFTVEFTRNRENGDVYFSGLVYYVWTKQEGEWGMQYRSGDPLYGRHERADIDEAVSAATEAVNEFFVAFNATDNDALREVNHVPQIMLNRDFFVHAESDDSPIVTMAFNRMREQENWLRSGLIDLEVSYATPSRVFFNLAFERYDQNDELYRTVPALWVLSKRNNIWGVDFRSLMEPSFQR